MSPKSRGRPPGRGRSRRPNRRPATGRGRATPFSGPAGAEPEENAAAEPGETAGSEAEENAEPQENADCWFDEPEPGDRRAWAVPAGHGAYAGLDLERLDPDDEDERGILLEARHAGIRWDADVNPRLHVSMHQVVANQVLTDNPPETWQTVQRLADLGYDWHSVMHMIGEVVSEDIHRALTEKQPFDLADYVRRLGELPGDWPPPQGQD